MISYLPRGVNNAKRLFLNSDIMAFLTDMTLNLRMAFFYNTHNRDNCSIIRAEVLITNPLDFRVFATGQGRVST